MFPRLRNTDPDIARASMEAIAFQNGALFSELTDIIGQIRRGGKYDAKSIAKFEINKIVAMHTGMKIDFMIDPAPYANAWAAFPDIDRNHPFLYARGIDFFFDSSEGRAALNVMGENLQGVVNLKESKVSGIYSAIECKTAVTSGLIKSKQYADDEVAAIILHELGHLFTYFEYLGTFVTSCHIISHLSKEVVGIEKYEDRVHIINKSANALGLDELIDAERLAKIPKPMREASITAIFIDSIGRQTRSELGFSIYDIRTTEQLADQFATRHGAGRALVTGMGKLLKGDYSSMPTAMRMFLELQKLLIAGGLLVAGVWPLAVMYILLNLISAANYGYELYDPPEARLRLIRQTVQAQLKNPELPTDRRKELVEDIAAMKEIEGKFKDGRNFLEWIWTTVLPGRKTYDTEKLLKAVEDLLHNDLFVKGSQFLVEAETANG